MHRKNPRGGDFFYEVQGIYQLYIAIQLNGFSLTVLTFELLEPH
jgi:hypothetical protein